MASSVVLHVGLMKSGTSFVQEVFKNNTSRLREQQVLFPEPWGAQVAGVKDVIAHGGPQQPPLAPDGPWRRLVAEIDRWPGVAVVSMEFLGPRLPLKIKQVLAALPDAEVRVVITARDLTRTIPAMWQEHVQNGGTTTWTDYVRRVREASEEAGGAGGPGSLRGEFWKRHDLPTLVERWQAAAGPERVTLVTVPPPGADPALLWQRIAPACGLDPEGFDLAVRANTSLGLASLEVLRELNTRLAVRDGRGSAVSPGDYERVVKQVLAKRGLAGRTGEPRLGYDAGWLRERTATQLYRLQQLDVRLVGSLGDLEGAAVVPGSLPGDLTEAERLAASLDALAFLTKRLARSSRGQGKGRARGGRRR